ncbi:MAG: hypothetical protein AAF737_02410 [Pseudomonadota bacterium]
MADRHLIYDYREASRSWLVLITSLVGSFLTTLGALQGAGWWTIGTGTMTAVSLWYFVADIRFGSRLNRDTFMWWDGKRREVLATEDIAGFELQSWSDSVDYRIRMADGSARSVPSNAMPGERRLRHWLAGTRYEILTR